MGVSVRDHEVGMLQSWMGLGPFNEQKQRVYRERALRAEPSGPWWTTDAAAIAFIAST